MLTGLLRAGHKATIYAINYPHIADFINKTSQLPSTSPKMTMMLLICSSLSDFVYSLDIFIKSQ